MSIYATWLAIDADDHDVDTCAKWVLMASDEPESGAMAYGDGQRYRFDKGPGCTCGNPGPLVYHGSHVSPSEDGQRGGSVSVCAIPDHCHPDARGDIDDAGQLVDFLRLFVTEDPDTYQQAIGQAVVILDRTKVVELRDTLTTWLDAEERG